MQLMPGSTDWHCRRDSGRVVPVDLICHSGCCKCAGFGWESDVLACPYLIPGGWLSVASPAACCQAAPAVLGADASQVVLPLVTGGIGLLTVFRQL